MLNDLKLENKPKTCIPVQGGWGFGPSYKSFWIFGEK
jgi:hypothetical protein